MCKRNSRYRSVPISDKSESHMFRMIGVIISLGVVIQFGMIADYDLEDYQTVADEVSEYLFTVYFIVEMVMRFFVYRRPVHFFRDSDNWKWNSSNLAFVLIRSVRVFVISNIGVADSGNSAVRLVKVNAMLRIFRILYASADVAPMVDRLRSAAKSAFPILCLFVSSLY